MKGLDRKIVQLMSTPGSEDSWSWKSLSGCLIPLMGDSKKARDMFQTCVQPYRREADLAFFSPFAGETNRVFGGSSWE